MAIQSIVAQKTPQALDKRVGVWDQGRSKSPGETLHLFRRYILGIFLTVFATLACSSESTGDRPQAVYDNETGRLRTITFDANKNGKNDSVSYMDGTRIVRIELDLDENGKVERWDFYGLYGELEKVGSSSLNDGVMDSQAFYGAANAFQRIEISTKRDGRFDKTEFYERNHNLLVRTEEDTNGDSRPDKWDTYEPNPNAKAGEAGYTITSTAFDDTGTGRPNRRFVYGPDGAISRFEVDPEGDGTFVTKFASSSTR